MKDLLRYKTVSFLLIVIILMGTGLILWNHLKSAKRRKAVREIISFQKSIKEPITLCKKVTDQDVRDWIRNGSSLRPNDILLYVYIDTAKDGKTSGNEFGVPAQELIKSEVLLKTLAAFGLIESDIPMHDCSIW